MDAAATLVAPARAEPAGLSKTRRWTGLAFTTVSVLFLLLDGAAKLAKPAPVVKGTIELGYPEGVIVSLGIALLVSTILYAIPRTAVLGAILLTGYLGGAVATHVRVAHPLFTHTLFPVYFAVLIWGGLVLRDPRLGALLPLRRERGSPKSELDR